MHCFIAAFQHSEQQSGIYRSLRGPAGILQHLTGLENIQKLYFPLQEVWLQDLILELRLEMGWWPTRASWHFFLTAATEESLFMESLHSLTAQDFSHLLQSSGLCLRKTSRPSPPPQFHSWKQILSLRTLCSRRSMIRYCHQSAMEKCCAHSWLICSGKSGSSWFSCRSTILNKTSLQYFSI